MKEVALVISSFIVLLDAITIACLCYKIDDNFIDKVRTVVKEFKSLPIQLSINTSFKRNELENMQLLIKSLLVFDSFELCISLIDLVFSIKIYRQIKVNSVES